MGTVKKSHVLPTARFLYGCGMEYYLVEDRFYSIFAHYRYNSVLKVVKEALEE
jgi:hypothetical protein